MCRTASLSSCQTVTLESFQVSHKSFQVSHGSGLQNSSRATFADESRLAFFGLPIHQRECWRPPPPPNSTAQMEMSQLSLFVDEPTDEETKQALESLKLDDQQMDEEQMDEDKDTDRTEEDTEEDTEEEEATSRPPRPFHMAHPHVSPHIITRCLFLREASLAQTHCLSPHARCIFSRLKIRFEMIVSGISVDWVCTSRKTARRGVSSSSSPGELSHLPIFSTCSDRFPLMSRSHFFPCDHTRICDFSSLAHHAPPRSPSTGGAGGGGTLSGGTKFDSGGGTPLLDDAREDDLDGNLEINLVVLAGETVAGVLTPAAARARLESFREHSAAGCVEYRLFARSLARSETFPKLVDASELSPEAAAAAAAAAAIGWLFGGSGDASGLMTRPGWLGGAVPLQRGDVDAIAMEAMADSLEKRGERAAEGLAAQPWLERFMELARRSEAGWSPFQVLVLLHCMEKRSAHSAAIYVVARALARINLQRLEGARAMPTPSMLELDRRIGRAEAALAQGEIGSAFAATVRNFALLSLAAGILAWLLVSVLVDGLGELFN